MTKNGIYVNIIRLSKDSRCIYCINPAEEQA